MVSRGSKSEFTETEREKIRLLFKGKIRWEIRTTLNYAKEIT